MHLESSKLLVGRVRAADRCRSGRPRSSPTRTRSRTCSAPTASTGSLDVCGDGCRSTSASWPRRACPRRASSRRAARSRRATSRACCAAAGCSALAEMMNFPGVDRRRPARAGEARRSGATHVDGHAPGVLGPALQAYAAAGIRSDHEALDARGGPRAAARRDVAADPRGVGRAQPRTRSLPLRRRVRAGADRVLHRRPRARAHRRRRAHQLDGARRGRGGDRARGRARRWRRSTRRAWHGLSRPRRGRARLPGRPARAARPRAVRAGARAEARARRWPRSRGPRCPTGCGTPCGSAGRVERLPRPVGRRAARA